MTMQDNIDIVGRNSRRNMLQPKLQTRTGKIDNQRPVRIPIAIAAHHGERRADRLEIIDDRRLANVAEMPDLVRLAGKIQNRLWKFVMRIRQNEYLHSTESGTTDTTGTKIAILNFKVTLVAFVRGLNLEHVI